MEDKEAEARKKDALVLYQRVHRCKSSINMRVEAQKTQKSWAWGWPGALAASEAPSYCQ